MVRVQILLPMSIPNSYNPSDYEYLLRSLTEGSHAAKAEALKRFQILASSDKKQFAVYAKRIILAMQELVSEPKEEIDIQASMLILEIVNLNPKDIQYYIKTKLLRKVILNLGDSKPQLRKTSHYAILAFIKTFKNIDEVLTLYSEQAITSPEPQLRQKAINSFQSIIITDSSSLNWNSPEFKKIFELLLQKLKDASPYVQKASEQCLLTLSRMAQVHTFSKKLSPSLAGIYKAFCDNQRQLGNLQSINLDGENHPGMNRAALQSQHSKSEKSISQNTASNEKISKITKQDAINKQALIQKIQELRRNSQAPVSIPDPLVRQKELREEKERQKLVPLFSHRAKDEKTKEKSAGQQSQSDDKKIHPVIFATKGEKLDNVFGKKLFEDLKNEKDWKIRLQAIEELASKFEIYKEAIEPEVLIHNLLPPLIKLLSDQNFKISTITLKVFEQFLRVPEISLETVAPQIVQKLGDGKVVLRQGIARLIRSQYLRLYNPIWIDCLLQLMKRAPNPILKEEILGILIRLYEDEVVRYPVEKIITSVCPLMDDPKTKIKIRTLDLLVKITIATQKVDAIKTILSGTLNQVYFEMYLEKVNMENKQRVTPRLTESEPPPRGESRSLSFPSLRKHNNSANNTTSTSLQKYSKTVEAKPIHRGTSDITPISNSSYNTVEDTSQYDQFQQINSRGPLTPHQSVRKKPVKNNFKKRMQKSIQTKLSITHTAETQGLRPFSDPEKQLRMLGNDLKSDDWQAAFDALTKLRRMLKFHNEILVPVISRPLVIQTAKLIQSLRSSLSKNAVITLGQCAQVLKRSLDPELDNIFSRLMRKTLDTNSFISQEVKKTLILVSTYCNETKVLSILSNYHTSRAIPIKLNILSVLQVMSLQSRIVEKEYEKIVSILVDFMGEGALEIRDRSKNLLNRLLDEDKQDKIRKLIPSDLLLKFKKYTASGSKLIKEASIMSMPSIKLAQPSHRQELAPVKKKILSFPKEFEELEDLLTGCETAEWKIRQVSLSKIATLVKAYPLQISQYRLNTRIIEMFGKHSNDPNSKVSTSALTHFMQIVPLVPKLIESNLSILSNELFSCFASQKPEVRELSLHLFDMIADKVQNWMLVQHLCTGVLYGPAKAKPNILFKILKVLPSAYKEKRAIAEKHVVSLINKLSEDSKGETLPILRELISTCVNLGGDEVYGALKQSAKSLIEN